MSYVVTPDGARLRRCDYGSGEQTIVLLHGWKGSHRLWDSAILRLSQNFRVLAFDTRGMGESDKPSGRYDFGVLAQDLAFVLEDAGAREVTLTGWSMGCSIALEYLARGGDRAARLVLINGPIKLENSDDFRLGLPTGQLESVIDDLIVGWPAAELDFARDAVRDPDGAFADFYYRTALQTPLKESIGIVREQAMLDHRSLLGRLELPVLAIYGRHDPYYGPALAEYIAENTPNGRYLIFEQSAHAVHYDEPDHFCDVISRFTRGASP